MKQVLVRDTDICVSRLSFGTAGLHHIGDQAGRQRLLLAAVEAGFSHFDTSPYYGFGIAERALAPILARFPELTVTTKVGLYPPGGVRQASALVLARKALGKLLPSLSRPIVDWQVARARDSLTGSLRALGRQRVDLLLLHEPDPALIDTDEWQRWLEREQGQRIRGYGVAGRLDQVAPFVERSLPLARVVQTGDSLERREADPLLAAGRPPQFTYGYFSSLGRGAAGDAAEILGGALHRNRQGSILIGTRRLDRLQQLAALVERLEGS